jgi:hypothetical protein
VLDDASWEGFLIKTSWAHVKDKHGGGKDDFVLQEISESTWTKEDKKLHKVKEGGIDLIIKNKGVAEGVWPMDSCQACGHKDIKQQEASGRRIEARQEGRILGRSSQVGRPALFVQPQTSIFLR